MERASAVDGSRRPAHDRVKVMRKPWHQNGQALQKRQDMTADGNLAVFLGGTSALGGAVDGLDCRAAGSWI